MRHISFSHFESDECGSLNEWLGAATKADVICSQVGALVSVNDFIGHESRALPDGETFTTGKYRFRYCQTPHLPHGWDAGMLFEETQKTLLCANSRPHHAELVAFTPNGRTRVQVIWTLSVKRIDDRSCEYTNSVVAHPTTEFMDFIARQNITFEDAAAARQRDGGDHNRREAPLFAASIERNATGDSQAR